MKSLFFMLALTSAAFAKDFAVTDQDQQNIQGICDAAATSPSITRDMRAGIANWCVQWEKRIQEAAKPEAQPESPGK